jgi:putative ABC transport system permease protein
LSRITTLSAFGDFSTIEFTMAGLGEPRVVRAGVVSGSYFPVMGLRAVAGRLIEESDDGPDADGVVVLTHSGRRRSARTRTSSAGRAARRARRHHHRRAAAIGAVPGRNRDHANVVTSPHHLDATMVEGRVHRMTEIFGRLAPEADVDAAVSELRTAPAAITTAYPEAYPASADLRINAVLLRDRITAPARTVLLVLLAAAALVFVIACVRLAVGSEPRHLLAGVLRDGGVIAVTGIVAGVVGGLLLARVAGAWIEQVRTPGAATVMAAATILVVAALLVSLIPAARAARVDVMQALRSD